MAGLIPPTLPIGLPGLAMAATGTVAFAVTLLMARARRSPPGPGSSRSANRSWIGIAGQGLGFGLVIAHPGPTVLDPLSPVALTQAGAVAALMVAAVTLFAWSTRTLGRQWSLVARTRSDHELMTTGPFAHVRHPIYAAMLLQMLALTIALGTAWRLIVALPLFLLGTAWRVREEERLLRAAFGAGYVNYMARVPRLVPRIVRRRR